MNRRKFVRLSFVTAALSPLFPVLAKKATEYDRFAYCRPLLEQIKTSLADSTQYCLFDPNNESVMSSLKKIMNDTLEQFQKRNSIESYCVGDFVIKNNTTLEGSIFVRPTKTPDNIVLDFTLERISSDFEVG